MAGEIPERERWRQGILISLVELEMWIGRANREFRAD